MGINTLLGQVNATETGIEVPDNGEVPIAGGRADVASIAEPRAAP